MPKELKYQLSVALCWAIMVNSVHMSAMVYGLPAELSTLVVPAFAGAYMGLRFGLKKGLISNMLFLLITTIILYTLLDLPSRLGILSPEFVPLFDLIIGLKVIRSIILISLFSIVTELIASTGIEMFKF